ncbi:hypothetical protein ACG33_09970 [Steroidobacter denitrificans]|uniref:Tyr recombinase domain-containing protein n=1 Tax=Steroidobacter denitrificans TaxID=465721 RepID=A0A127FAH0_STEDE|nr:tyrosine-type recombinase/integrase [Steroidobacter denitrificans]AMN47416.1 hypothetical protein ACG33_09970 [Steroidobacter denitrificans]
MKKRQLDHVLRAAGRIPANSVGAASIATFVPKDRALSPLEIRLFVQQMGSVATYPTIKLALRLILLTLVRKSELIQATWDEVDFESKTWTIPKQRMKGRNPHMVYQPLFFDRGTPR